MKLGIRAHDVGKHSADELAKIISHYQFEAVQLVLNKAIACDNVLEMMQDETSLYEIAKPFKENNINIAMLGAYFNPIHSDKEKVAKSMSYFRKHLEICSIFNTKYVGTETGSYNDDQWTFHVNNQSEAAYQEVKRCFEQLLVTAKENDVKLAIEPAAHHVISTPVMLKRLIKDLNDKFVVVTFDLYNLLNVTNFMEQEKIIDEMVELFGEQIKIVHLKDFVYEQNTLKQVSLGDGILNFDYLFNKLSHLSEEITFIFEGVTGIDIERSMKFIKKKNP